MQIQAFLRLCAILGLGLCTSLASADIVTLSVTGTVDSVYDPSNALGGQVSVGQSVVGEYSYDTAAPDMDSSPEYGGYPQDRRTVQMAFDIGSLRFASDPDATAGPYEAHVMNAPWGDGFHVGSSEGNRPLSTGATVLAIDVDLYDVTGTALSSDALPTTVPNLAAFTDPFVYVFGHSPSGDYYDFRVRIDSLSDGAPQGTFAITAEVFDVYDPENALGGQVVPGSRITGTHRIDVTIPDQNPHPNHGHYPHDMKPGFGFELNAGTLSFQTDSAEKLMIVDIDDGISGSNDLYKVRAKGGTWLPQAAGLVYIDMFLEDPDGDALVSDALRSMVPDLALFNGPRELRIKGSAPSGVATWYIQARVLEMRPAGESANIVMVSPGDSHFVAGQRFDAAFILPPGQDLDWVQGTINGMSVPEPYLLGCLRLPPDLEGHPALLCPDMHQFLLPGTNTVRWTFELVDGTVATEWVDWTLLR